jgi:amidase
LGFHLSESQLKEYQGVIDANLSLYDNLAFLPDNLPVVKYSRTPGYIPDFKDNKLNAWYIRCEVKGESQGKLAGKKVVLKDNICLAGVKMMNGCEILEGYTPEIDATIVTRLLGAGATIIGKANCENLCISGGSFTGAKGPVHNPHKYGYQAGGSSCGTAALVGSGEVEMGIGGD